jgi:hypothetical protein
VSPWNVELHCERGRIYAHGGSKLQAYTDRPRIGAALARLACVRVHQQGEDEVTVTFDVRDFAAVAAILRPIRRKAGRVGGPAPSVFPSAVYDHLTARQGAISSLPLVAGCLIARR